MYRKVYLDFQDGNGYRDISSLVKYESLNITLRACSNNFHYAQNECSFDVIYDSTIYSLLRYASKDIICKVVDVYDEALITAENDYFLTTEDGFYLAREVGGFAPLFYGRIPHTKSRTYNGILNNTIWSVSAEDDLLQLDTAVGDICYTNYSIMNPSSPTTSIVHQLAYMAGFTAAQMGNVVISNTIAKFAPNDENDSILDILDALLFEYGYVLNIDADGKITPIKWIQTDAATFGFTESNMIKEVSVDDGVQSYYGANVVWYELKQAITTSGNQNILLYHDDDCGYDSTGAFSGYYIPSGYYYPFACNAIDTVTSGNQVVYQEYSNDAVGYWTNYAIVQRLDYNYRAFDSDFSAIVATSGQWLDKEVDPGITLVAEEYYNKKARILYYGTTSGYIWYNNIYGNVWYKSDERSIKVDNTTVSGQKIDNYVSNWIFDAVTASGLVRYLAAQHSIGETYYTIYSEADRAVNEIVNVSMNDGTNQDCFIMEKQWAEDTQYYTYKCRAHSADLGTVSKNTYSNGNMLILPETVSCILTPNNISVSANVDGSNPILTNAYTDCTVRFGVNDVTQDWTYEATTSGITGSFGTGTLKNRYTITGFASNALVQGFVDITASRTGFGSQTNRFWVNKIFQSDAATAANLTVISGLASDAYDDAQQALTGVLTVSGMAVTAQNSAIVASGLAMTAQSMAATASGLANSAYNLADGKITSYWQISPPSSGMDTGDIWFDTDDGNIQYIYTTSGWVLARDTGIATALANAATASGLADSKSTVFYQTSQPTISGTTYQGDLWVDTDDNNKLWAYTGSGWVLAQDWYSANALATTASGLAVAAQAIATTASGLAIQALGELDDLATDGIVTPNEKNTIAYRNWNSAVGEYAELVSDAAAVSVSSAGYVSAYNALNTYLNTTIKVFNNFTTNTTLSGYLLTEAGDFLVTEAGNKMTMEEGRTQWNGIWNEYYYQRTTLLNNIATAIKAIADSKTTLVETVATVPTYTPHYYGKYLDSIPTGTFVTGDTYCRYSESSGTSNRGVFVYSGGWTRTEEIRYVNEALADISFLIAYRNPSGEYIYGVASDYTSNSTLQANFAFFQTAMIGFLQANNIKLTASGSLYGGDRYNADGSDNNTSASGFWMGADGRWKSKSGSIEAATISGSTVNAATINGGSMSAATISGNSIQANNVVGTLTLDSDVRWALLTEDKHMGIDPTPGIGEADGLVISSGDVTALSGTDYTYLATRAPTGHVVAGRPIEQWGYGSIALTEGYLQNDTSLSGFASWADTGKTYKSGINRVRFTQRGVKLVDGGIFTDSALSRSADSWKNVHTFTNGESGFIEVCVYDYSATTYTFALYYVYCNNSTLTWEPLAGIAPPSSVLTTSGLTVQIKSPDTDDWSHTQANYIKLMMRFH